MATIEVGDLAVTADQPQAAVADLPPAAPAHQPVPAPSSRRRPRPAAHDLLLAALALSGALLLPFLLGYLAAPRGTVFRATLKAVGDEGIYQSAVNAGMHGHWLFPDPYMAHPPAPIVDYAPYVLAGQLGAIFHLSVAATYILLHLAAGLALLAALWHLSRRYLAEGERPWFAAFALCFSGLYWFDAVLSLVGHAPVTLAWLGLPPLAGYTSALMGTHETLALAAGCVVLDGLLRVQCAMGNARWRGVAIGAAGMAALGICMPALLPLPLLLVGIWSVWDLDANRRREKRLAPARLVPWWSIAAPGVLIAAYYFWALRIGPWAASDFTVIYTPGLLEAVITWAALSPLAWWGWKNASPAARPLAAALALWYVLGAVLSEVPLTEFFRFTLGVNVLGGGLLALGLAGRSAPRKRRMRLLQGTALGAATQLLFLLSVLGSGAAPHLYISTAEDAAMRWLGVHGTAGNLVLAPLGFSNVAADYAPCHFVTGYQTLTFDFVLRERQLRVLYGATGSTAARLAVVRAIDPTYVVYDRFDSEDGTSDPALLPGLRSVFSLDGVVILRVTSPL